MYHIRITSTDEKFRRFLIQNFKFYVMVQEDADEEVSRTHTHIHAEDPMFAEQTIRNKLSELTEGNRNKMFSFKRVKKGRDDNIQYLCKGKSEDDMPNVLMNNLCTQEEIERYHKVYWEIRNKKRVPKVRLSFLEEVIERSREEPWATKFKTEMDYITPYMKRSMFQLVTMMLGEKKKILDPMIIRRLCNGVFNVIQPYKYRDDNLFNEVYPISSESQW